MVASTLHHVSRRLSTSIDDFDGCWSRDKSERNALATERTDSRQGRNRKKAAAGPGDLLQPEL